MIGVEFLISLVLMNLLKLRVSLVNCELEVIGLMMWLGSF